MNERLSPLSKSTNGKNKEKHKLVAPAILIRTAGAIRYLVCFLFFRFWARAVHK